MEPKADIIILELIGFRHGETEFFRLLGCYAAWRWFQADVLELPTSSLFNGQNVFLYVLILEDGTDR